MINNRTNETHTFASIFQQAQFQPTQKSVDASVHAKSRTNQHKINLPVTRTERMMYPESLSPLQPLTAVYPFLDKKAFRMTIDNFRLYVSKYNAKVLSSNDAIADYNEKIVELNKLKDYNDLQKQFMKNWQKTNKNLNPKKYNAMVDNLRNEKGFMVEKKKYLTIKYGSIEVFQNMLHDYASQLTKYTNEYIKIGAVETRTIRPIEINSCKITNLQRTTSEGNVLSLDVCKATIRNHRARLEEAGIFVEYKFRGKTKGIKMHINPEILVVLDAKTNLYTFTENQYFTPDSLKEFTEIKDNTRTFITINKNKIDKKIDFSLGTASPIFSSSFYQNIPKQSEKSGNTVAAQNVKVSENSTEIQPKSQTLSEKLTDYLNADVDLSKNLASGAFFNYKHLDSRTLDKEVYSGTMLRSEFGELMIHEIVKHLSRIYRNSTPYEGSYTKAITMLKEKLFVINNGNGNFLFNKALMLETFQQWIWRINSAQKWFIKTGIRPLNPHDYLDFTRTNKKEIGFAYTKKAWINHLKKQENKPLETKKVLKNATNRTKKIDYDKKFNFKMNQFFRNAIAFDDLIEYVTDNLPKQYLDNLSSQLLKLSTKYTC